MSNITGLMLPTDVRCTSRINRLRAPLLSAVSAIALPLCGSIKNQTAITRNCAFREGEELDIVLSSSENWNVDGNALLGNQTAITEGMVFLSLENSQLDVADFLRSAGLAPDRESTTADGSNLLEFFRERIAGVDVYPNVEIVVILPQGNIDHVYEFDMSELPQIVNLLKNGGLAG
jgi:hypothetical protein